MFTFFALLMVVLLVGIDQAVKVWALDVLAPQHQIPVIENLFSLTYVENRGAAFGILQGRTDLLSILTGIVLLAVLVVLLSGRLQGRFLIVSVSLILAGGIGNLIDRIWRGFVVDYLDFSSLMGFPVFNFADCCVVVGTLLLLCYVFRQEQKQKKLGALKDVQE